jgi:hypothetical protein
VTSPHVALAPRVLFREWGQVMEPSFHQRDHYHFAGSTEYSLFGTVYFTVAEKAYRRVGALNVRREPLKLDVKNDHGAWVLGNV